MSATTTTLSIAEHQGSTEVNNDAGTEDMARSERGGALVGTSPAQNAALSAPERDGRADEACELGAAAPSSQGADNSQQNVERAASRAPTAPASRVSMQGGERGTRYSTYPPPPNTDNHNDLHPAALLESLASFDHTQAHNSATTYGEQESHSYQPNHQSHANQFENDHFASLLQAAATAGQNQENEHINHYDNDSGRLSQPLQEWSIRTQPRPYSQKRKHPDASRNAASTPNTDSSSHFDSRSSRRKLAPEADDGALAREHAIWGPSDHSEGEAEEPSTSYTRLSPSSARAAGVHSAAALFRKPTSASKKYTRPPMSKLFTSLELGPEQFLHLQAAAKSYMLDSAHPDRYNCVGSKAKVDTDMVKLKLFGCVETFLEDEGWGERCWGANAEREQLHDTRNWRLRWPETRNKIITSVTPLMRRMVTNERQRRYANETRSKEKGGKTMKPAAVHSTDVHNQQIELSPEIDPKLGDYHYTPTAPNLHDTPQTAAMDQPQDSATTCFKIAILCPTITQQIIHSTTLSISSDTSYQGVVQCIRSWLVKSEIAKHPDGELGIAVLAVHLPSGLREIKAIEDWEDAIRVVQETVWMEGILRVIVEVGSAEGLPKKGSAPALVQSP